MESETKTLFVGNLPYEITERDLEVEFAPYGLHWIRLVPDRGIAFIDIDAGRIQEAVDEKHDCELWGRRLTVNESRPKEKEETSYRPGSQWEDDRNAGPPRPKGPGPDRTPRRDGPGGQESPRRFGNPGHPKGPGADRRGNDDRPRFPRRRD